MIAAGRRAYGPSTRPSHNDAKLGTGPASTDPL